jgi:hypothetical protein
MTNTKMTLSEKIVTGLAVAVLVAAFATGVFAKPMNFSRHADKLIARNGRCASPRGQIRQWIFAIQSRHPSSADRMTEIVFGGRALVWHQLRIATRVRVGTGESAR